MTVYQKRQMRFRAAYGKAQRAENKLMGMKNLHIYLNSTLERKT